MRKIVLFKVKVWFWCSGAKNKVVEGVDEQRREFIYSVEIAFLGLVVSCLTVSSTRIPPAEHHHSHSIRKSFSI
jgi:hypothetical protein